jgi:hypothetical protein
MERIKKEKECLEDSEVCGEQLHNELSEELRQIG